MAYIIRIDDESGDAERLRGLKEALESYCRDSRWAELADSDAGEIGGRIDIKVRGTGRFAKVRKEIEAIVAQYGSAAVSVHRQVME